VPVSRGARWTIIAFLLLFAWMSLYGWSSDTNAQRGFEIGFVAFMLALALGLAAPARFLWALRLVAGTVAAGYLAYFVFEVVKLLGGEKQPFSINNPNATAAGFGLLIYGVPALVFALGAKRIGIARLLDRRPRDEPPIVDRPDDDQPPQHAVIVHFTYGSTDLAPLSALEDRLIAAIAAADAGEFDGNEVAVDGSDGYLYMYGPDADALFAAIRPVLETAPFMNGARVTIRYGSPDDDVAEREVVLGGSGH
jgi:hypothetical protein